MKEEIIKICKEFGLENPNISLTNNYTKIGVCCSNGNIEISRIAFKYNDDEGKRMIIGHEVAHLKHFNHKKEFKDLAIKMGVDEKKIISVSRYVSFCPRCRTVCKLNNLKKGKYFCKVCEKIDIKQEVMFYKHYNR